MTDLNIVLSSAETGEVKDRFSVHRGTASTMESLVSRVRDAIHSEMDLDMFVHVPKEGHGTSWETISPFVSRLVIPGGWIYKVDDNIAFVPDPEWKPKFDEAGGRTR